MTQFTINRDNIGAFLSSFGKDLGDIAFVVSKDSIQATVAKSTHYVYRKTDCDIITPGNLYISDIPKVKSFLSTNKIPELSFSQEGKTGTLYIRCGNTSLQLPTTSHIESQTKVGLMAKTVAESKESMWRTWFNKPLTHHAQVSAESLKPATGFKKVLGDKFACKTEFDVDGEQFIIRGGKSETGKMFVKAPLTHVEATGIPVRSAFDKWLPELINNLPVGDFELHTGDETVLILEQPETDFLMVVIDQVYEED